MGDIAFEARMRAAGLPEEDIQRVLAQQTQPVTIITLRVPSTLVAELDAVTPNRSEYIRGLIERDLRA